MSPEEIAARDACVAEREKKERGESDIALANSNFDAIWLNEIMFQRGHFRVEGKFRKTEFSTPSEDKFYFKYSYYGVEIDSHWEVEWDRKSARTTLKSWTNP